MAFPLSSIRDRLIDSFLKSELIEVREMAGKFRGIESKQIELCCNRRTVYLSLLIAHTLRLKVPTAVSIPGYHHIKIFVM